MLMKMGKTFVMYSSILIQVGNGKHLLILIAIIRICIQKNMESHTFQLKITQPLQIQIQI